MFRSVEKALNDFQGTLDYLSDLGSSHVSNEVQVAHYAVVKQALLVTLGQALGDDFTDELRKEWDGAFDMVTEAKTKGKY